MVQARRETGPIFVGGVAHSGKTQLRLALDAHPDIAMTRRTYMWPGFFNRYGDLADPANFERCLTAMLGHPPIRALVPEPDSIRDAFWRGVPTYGHLFAIIHGQHAARVGKRRWGDQLGLVEQYADAIFDAYPAARIVHMVRDPRDRGGAAAGPVGRAVAEWRWSARLAERNRQRYTARYRVLHFESLMATPERTLRELCHFLGEDLVPAMLDAVADSAPDIASGERPSVREVALVQTLLRREMQAQGYPPVPVRLSLGEWVRLACVDAPVHLARAGGWYTLHALRYTLPARLGRGLSPTKVDPARDRRSNDQPKPVPHRVRREL